MQSDLFYNTGEIVKKLVLDKTSIVYIFDKGSRTGGGEALFQLRLDLENLGYHCKIVSKNREVYNTPLPDKFKKYVKSKDDFCLPEDVADDSKNCLIVPEVATTFLFEYKNIQKVIWWLSSRYYDGKCRIENRPEFLRYQIMAIGDVARFVAKSMIRLLKYHRFKYPLNQAYNIAGYNHVKEILSNHYKVDSVLLIHSIGIDFLERGMYTDSANREDFVLYNPKKPSKIVCKLLERKKYHFIPIQGMTVEQMVSLFRKSKVYIDFGQFPGPERLPKETVFNGVNVIVGKRNTACNYQDVMVPEQFKISPNASIEEVEEKIDLLLRDYEKYLPLYDSYRNMVQNMENNYYKQLKDIFGRLI